MQPIQYGRRRFSFSNGRALHTSTIVTVQANTDENECAFTQRLLAECSAKEGTIEIVFKAGIPQYAVVTIGPDTTVAFNK
jgi:hypothetical protein